jgi:agmatine/peptidylarginine deiminase
MRRLLALPACIICLVCVQVSAPAQQLEEPQWTGGRLVYPEGGAIPRSLTEPERRYLAEHPLVAELLETPPPEGPIHCPAEYEPMDGILISWEGWGGWRAILALMGAQITTTGDANLYVVVDDDGERLNAEAELGASGADMSRVRFMIADTDTIWIRDYGPRYIYEGGCRAIVDHTYNRPRPNDDAFPEFFATFKNHARYEIPLVHGGGNYHLDNLDHSFVSRLISNENSWLSEAEIHQLWWDYQHLDTTFFDPFPTWVDSTQHIDMWMQVVADDAVMISDWPMDEGSTQDLICDQAAALLSGRGYTVHRLPARSVGGTHYTYTNMVMCNDLLLIPAYSNGQVAPHNDEALAIYQAALPGKTVVQVDAEDIVSASGVLHCIVMHVPAHLGGENPTAHLHAPRGCRRLEPGSQQQIRWISDDDRQVVEVDLRLSTDGGFSYPTVIAQALPDTGSYLWTVPAMATVRGRIRVVVRDEEGNTGLDQSDRDLVIGTLSAGPAPPDPLLAVKAGGGLTTTFSGGADAFNVYQGPLGGWFAPDDSRCLIDQGDPSLVDNGDGSWSYPWDAAQPSYWFVVSGSNCFDESALHHPAPSCGPTP